MGMVSVDVSKAYLHCYYLDTGDTLSGFFTQWSTPARDVPDIRPFIIFGRIPVPDNENGRMSGQTEDKTIIVHKLLNKFLLVNVTRTYWMKTKLYVESLQKETSI
jgi:hypothetical protein